ncbi:hypothetical protein C8R44DRAFT_229991 [Mycena epipterygia]|nr:hypothetical protein C8R44DRAFT_229991 [Mycena epipterygia]
MRAFNTLFIPILAVTSISLVHGPTAYGLCQTGCNTVVGSMLYGRRLRIRRGRRPCSTRSRRVQRSPLQMLGHLRHLRA